MNCVVINNFDIDFLWSKFIQIDLKLLYYLYIYEFNAVLRVELS